MRRVVAGPKIERVEGVVEELPTSERRTYRVRVGAEVLDLDWMLIDRIAPLSERTTRNPASVGGPITWDAHPPPSTGRRRERRIER